VEFTKFCKVHKTSISVKASAFAKATARQVDGQVGGQGGQQSFRATKVRASDPQRTETQPPLPYFEDIVALHPETPWLLLDTIPPNHDPVYSETEHIILVHHSRSPE